MSMVLVDPPMMTREIFAVAFEESHFSEVGNGDDAEWQGHLGNPRSGIGMILKARTMAKVGSPCALSLHGQSLNPRDATYLT